ncbi:hypothetical protein pb186bvf_005176 [Paramecium bursaria]
MFINIYQSKIGQLIFYTCLQLLKRNEWFRKQGKSFL